jgi:two-component system response regulator QseB
MRVLLVEDDSLLGDGIHNGLIQQGAAVDWVKSAPAADHALHANRYDAMILDLNIPQGDGLTILQNLRNSGDTMPVLILTARDSIADRVQGLDSGADDYMTKPFDMTELDARLRALIRRSKGRAAPELRHGDLIIDLASLTVTRGKEVIPLSRREFALLHVLLENTGKVMSRKSLEESLYAWKDEVDSNAVEVHIHRIRKKLGIDLIRTIRGVGYIVDKPT